MPYVVNETLGVQAEPLCLKHAFVSSFFCCSLTKGHKGVHVAAAYHYGAIVAISKDPTVWEAE